MVCCLKGICVHSHTIPPAKLAPDLKLLGCLLSEKNIHLRPYCTSILDICNVFESMACCLKGIWVYSYTIPPARLAPAWGLLGVVQAWVAHFVTPLKCMYDKYNWGVTSQKPHKKHKSPKKYHHHGGEAANPSSSVDLMNPRRPRGGRPCAHLFSGRHWRILFDSLN